MKHAHRCIPVIVVGVVVVVVVVVVVDCLVC